MKMLPPLSNKHDTNHTKQQTNKKREQTATI